MPEIGQETIYEWRLNSWNEIKDSLGKLMKNRERILATGLPLVDKMYDRIEPIRSASEIILEGNAYAEVDRGIMGSLNPYFLNYFADNPEQEGMRNFISSCLVMAAAGLNAFPEDEKFVPYTLEELGAVLAGRGDIYDDIIFVRSLRVYLEGENFEAEAALVLNALPSVGEIEDNKEEPLYFWDDAFTLSMMAETAWAHFFSFNDSGRQFLLQNYFYRAIVMGVPVKAWVKMAMESLENKAENDIIRTTILKMVEDSKEMAVINSETGARKPLAEIIKEYVSRIYKEDIDILAQEKFLEEMYADQIDGEMYAAWLREVLQIVLMLRKRETGERARILDIKY